MTRRIVFKTVVICTGAFVMLLSAALLYLSQNYRLDTEKRVRVVVANSYIAPGTIINESNVEYKIIRESSINSSMLMDLKETVGKKALSPIANGDYVAGHTLLPRENWHKDDEREIVLPMEFDERLANLITKGSLMDIKVLLNNTKSRPKLVLAKVRVEEIIDDNGLTPGESMGNRKGYARLTLSAEQRDRIYIAQQFGKLKYELYCDSTQKAAEEEFQIPVECMKDIPLEVKPQMKSQEKEKEN